MSYEHMVALGSSFASGPGLEPMADRRARRSSRNYPHLVARRIGAELVDATIAGATTRTILDTPQRVGVRSYPPQIESVTADADLVTITAGGNDLGYLADVVSTALLQQLWRRRLTRLVARRIRASRPLVPVNPQQAAAASDGLSRVVDAVRVRAPEARVVLVDYLPILPPPTGRAIGPFRAFEVEHVRAVAAALSRVFEVAARNTGAELVAASDYASGHGFESDVPWVFGLGSPGRLSSSFHPTAAGMEAVAAAVVDRLLGRRPHSAR